MRLVDLEPQFHTYLPGGDLGKVESLEHAHGIWFLCPACYVKNNGPVGTHEVLVWFADRGVAMEATPTPRWHVSGGTGYVDLTLTPSIDCTKNAQGIVDCPHEWHGFITNGEATNA